jgi:hypothetical protein
MFSPATLPVSVARPFFVISVFCFLLSLFAFLLSVFPISIFQSRFPLSPLPGPSWYNSPRPMTPIYPSETPRRRRVAGADRTMNEAGGIGTCPGLTPAMLDYMAETITKFVRSK